jgi:hypothetical protein
MSPAHARVAPGSHPVDLSLERIEAASGIIDPVVLKTPQFVDERLSAELGREVRSAELGRYL